MLCVRRAGACTVGDGAAARRKMSPGVPAGGVIPASGGARDPGIEDRVPNSAGGTAGGTGRGGLTHRNVEGVRGDGTREAVAAFANSAVLGRLCSVHSAVS